MKRHRLALLALVAVSVLAVAACGSSSKKSSSTGTNGSATTGSSNVSGKISIVGVWTGDEQKHFQAVLNGFKAKLRSIL